MSNIKVDAVRLRPDATGHIRLEFGQRTGGAAPAVPTDPAAAFVASHRILLTRELAQRLVDALALTLGRPIAPPAGPQPQAPGVPVAVQGPIALERAAGLAVVADEGLRRRGTTPLDAQPDPAGETAAWLMHAVREMAPEHYQERSLRMAPQSLHANRFLLSIDSRQLPSDALERTWSLCRHLGLPATLRIQVETAFAWADHVHFGFEGKGDQVWCKLYLEHTVSGLEAARARDSGEPALQYLAFKWNTATGEMVVSRYHWHVGLSPRAIEERVVELCGRPPSAMPDLARSVLSAAAARMLPQQLRYLEVTEEGQPRHSFDLNLYDAHLLVRDPQPVLFGMRDYFDVRPGQFQALYDQIKTRPLGHLAGGVHRNGQEFFTVYYGGTRRR